MDNNYTNIYGNQTKKGVKTDFDLSQVEVVKVGDQEYLKYVNPETNEIELMENFSNDSLQTQFEKIRDYYSIKMGSNNKENTDKIIEFKQKYDSYKLNFVNILDLNRDFDKYSHNLNHDQCVVLKYLVINSQDLKIDKINLEKGIALDSEGKVVEASLNPATLEIEAKTAQTTKFEYQAQSSFTPSTNQADVTKSNQYTDEQYMEYPELLEKEYNDGLITLEEKTEIEKRIEHLKENNMLTNQHQKQYIYTLKDDRKAGFAEVALYPAIILIIGILIIASILALAVL